MQNIELKEFQINTVNKLLDATSIGDKKEVLVQAPTGSGKTIILLSSAYHMNYRLSIIPLQNLLQCFAAPEKTEKKA